MTDVALTPRPWLSPRTAWGFRVCERGRQCWAERSVSHRQRKGTKILVQVPLANQDVQPSVGPRST